MTHLFSEKEFDYCFKDYLKKSTMNDPKLTKNIMDAFKRFIDKEILKVINRCIEIVENYPELPPHMIHLRLVGETKAKEEIASAIKREFGKG